MCIRDSLDAVALLEDLPLDLLIFRQDGFGGADLHRGRSGAGIHAGNHRRHQLLIAALEFLHLLAPLRLADALADDVLGRLGGNAPEFLSLQRNFHRIAHLGGLGLTGGLFHGHFHIGILYLCLLYTSGPDSIPVFVVTEHRQLGAGACLPGNGLDFHHAVKNLGYFHFKQALHQPGVRAGNQGAGALIPCLLYTSWPYRIRASPPPCRGL